MFGMNTQKPALQKFRRTYGISDFGVTANKTFQPSQWNVAGELTVPAQQLVTFGANDPTGGTTVAGAPVYVKMETATATISGKIRFAITNANQTNTVVVMEESTTRLSASTNDRTLAPLFPEAGTKARQDSKLQVLIYVDGGSSLTWVYNSTSSLWQIPVTVYQ